MIFNVTIDSVQYDPKMVKLYKEIGFEFEPATYAKNACSTVNSIKMEFKDLDGLAAFCKKYAYNQVSIDFDGMVIDIDP